MHRFVMNVLEANGVDVHNVTRVMMSTWWDSTNQVQVPSRHMLFFTICQLHWTWCICKRMFSSFITKINTWIVQNRSLLFVFMKHYPNNSPAFHSKDNFCANRLMRLCFPAPWGRNNLSNFFLPHTKNGDQTPTFPGFGQWHTGHNCAALVTAKHDELSCCSLKRRRKHVTSAGLRALKSIDRPLQLQNVRCTFWHKSDGHWAARHHARAVHTEVYSCDRPSLKVSRH